MVRGFAVVATIGACALVATAASAQCPTPGTVSAVCSPEASCARIAVGNATGSSSAAGAVSITFNQGPDDSQAQRGHDDVAAIAFTVGIPGTGDTAPLVFDCVDGNLAAERRRGRLRHRRHLHGRRRERPVHRPQPLPLPGHRRRPGA